MKASTRSTVDGRGVGTAVGLARVDRPPRRLLWSVHYLVDLQAGRGGPPPGCLPLDLQDRPVHRPECTRTHLRRGGSAKRVLRPVLDNDNGHRRVQRESVQ